MGILGNIVKAIYKPIDVAVTTFAHPIQVTKAIFDPKTTVSQVVQKTIAEPKSKQITDVITAGLGYATALGGAVAIGTKGVVKAAASLIPSTTKGKIIAAVVAPVAISAVAQNPKIVTSTVPEVVPALTAFGSDIGKFSKDPSLENAKKIVTENPIVAGGLLLVGGAAAIPAAAALTNAYENIQTREAVKDLTKEISTTLPATLPTTEKIKSDPINNTQIAQAPVVASTPAVNKVTPTTLVKRKPLRLKKASPQQINQRVNVIVSNKNSSVGTKNYLNKRILLNQ